jgi:6-phosphofructokinase 1
MESNKKQKTMAIQKTKGIIAILTGGGDVPGLNPAIRAVTIRANREGYKVIGLRRGWAGISELIKDNKADNSNCYQILTDDIVNKAGRTGGTFLHTSRTRPSHMSKASVPEHLQGTYNQEMNDITPEIIKNLEWLGVDYLIPIGGDDTLSYGVHLYKKGVKVVAIRCSWYRLLHRIQHLCNKNHTDDKQSENFSWLSRKNSCS